MQDDELITTIRRQAEVLDNHGMICHSFWRGTGSEVFKGLFVNYQTEATLRTLFEDHFEILILEPYAEFEDADSLLLIGKKI